MLHDLPRRYDAIVVGARAAGAATALLLARHGLAVLVVERGAYGSDTLSTHALMRAGVLQLHRWGVLPHVIAAGTPAVRTTSFHYDGEAIEIPIKARDGVEALFAPRRNVLDRLLVDAARDAGATIVHGVRLTSLLRSGDGRVHGATLQHARDEPACVEAGIVIGADGAQSTVARLVGAAVTHAGVHCAATVYGYWSGLHVEGYQWHFSRSASAGAIPTNDGRTCLFAAVPQARFLAEVRSDLAGSYHRVIAEVAPRLAADLPHATLYGPLRGFAGLRGFFRQSRGPGWALVGDAGYFKDPITAHGISDAFRDAELLARAVATGSEAALAGYVSTRDTLARELFDVTERIASFEWDLRALQVEHKKLSDAMSQEVRDMVALWGTPTSAGHAVSSPSQLPPLASSRTAALAHPSTQLR
jgi:menaquinone-9 beta-reductase